MTRANDHIRQHWQTRSDAELAADLQCSQSWVRQLRWRMRFWRPRRVVTDKQRAWNRIVPGVVGNWE